MAYLHAAISYYREAPRERILHFPQGQMSQNMCMVFRRVALEHPQD